MAARGLMRRNNLKVTLNEVTNLYIEHIINSVLLVDVDTDKIKFVVDSLEMEYNFKVVYDKLAKFWEKVSKGQQEHVICSKGGKYKMRVVFNGVLSKSDEMLHEKIRESLDIPVYKPKQEKFLLKDFGNFIPTYLVHIEVEDNKKQKAYMKVGLSVATTGLICGEKYEGSDEEVDALGFEVDLSNVVGDLHDMINENVTCNSQLKERLYVDRDYGCINFYQPVPFEGLEVESEYILKVALKTWVDIMFNYMKDNSMLCS